MEAAAAVAQPVTPPPAGQRSASGTPARKKQRRCSSASQEVASQPRKAFPEPSILPLRLPGRQNGHDVSLPEILDIERVHEVLLCAGTWDAKWLMEDMKIATVRSTWVIDPRRGRANITRTDSDETRRKGGHPNRTLHQPPPLLLDGSLQSRFLVLLRNDDTMRLVVTTADLTPEDWGAACANENEPDAMDNGVFVVDVPLRTEAATTSETPPPAFYQHFRDFLGLLKLQPEWMQAIERYDFAVCARIGFVYTGGLRAAGTGFDSLREAISHLKLAPSVKDRLAQPAVEYTTPIVRNMEADAFVQRLFGAIRDVDDDRGADQLAEDRGLLTIVWPTKVAAEEAPNSACRFQYSLQFPEEGSPDWRLLDDCLSDVAKGQWLTNGRLIVTTWWTTAGKSINPHPSLRGWVYMGSAYPSCDTWGKLSYECGVLFPMARGGPTMSNVLIDLGATRLYRVPDMWRPDDPTLR